MEELVPIFICAVLPISIVLIIFSTVRNADNRRAEVLIKAIEANNNIDADALVRALEKPRKTPRQILFSRLLRGSICSLLGLLFIIIGVINLCSGSESASDPVPFMFMMGGIFLSIGLGYLIVFFATRRHIED